MRFLEVLPAAALLIGISGATVARAGEPPTRLPLAEATIPAEEEDWYAVSMLGARVAWTRYAIERVPVTDTTSLALVRVTQEHHIRVKLEGAAQSTVEARILEFDASPPYALRSARITMDAGGLTHSVRIERTATGFSSVRTVPSGTTETDLGALDFTLADLFAMRTWISGARKPGDVLVYRTFSTSTLRVAPTRAEVLDMGSIGTPGSTARWVDVRMEDAADGTTSTIRYDVGSGRSLYMVQGPYSLQLTTEAGAKSDALGHDLLDVLAVAKVDAPLGKASEVAGLVLEASGEGAAQLRSGPGQTVVRDATGNRVVLTLGGAAEGI